VLVKKWKGNAEAFNNVLSPPTNLTHPKIITGHILRANLSTAGTPMPTAILASKVFSDEITNNNK